MPAAAVIPAPIAYIKVVAVKKLVVELLGAAGRGLVYSGPLFARFIFWEVTPLRFTAGRGETHQLL